MNTMGLQLLSSGWIEDALHYPSPNFNKRPTTTPTTIPTTIPKTIPTTIPWVINCIVIHAISLPPKEHTLTHVIDFFQNKLDIQQHPYFSTIQNLTVSSHFVISREGLLCQLVSVYDRAWHAGDSSFDGVANCNDYAIGIELIGDDDTAFTDAQYRMLQKLIACLRKQFPSITKKRIVGHSQIAPGRKTDPGPCFNWDFLNKI